MDNISEIVQAPLTALLGISGIILFTGSLLKIKTKRWFEVPDENRGMIRTLFGAVDSRCNNYLRSCAKYEFDLFNIC